MRQAVRATRQLVLSVALTFGMYLFITVLLITATATVTLVGAFLLPETALLIRRIAGGRRTLAAEWTGRRIPEAYLPLTGTLRERITAWARDPSTYTDLRWMVLNYLYGALGLLVVPLWVAGLPVDGVRYGLLGRRPVVLPLISRLADLDAAWTSALLKPSRQALLDQRVAELTQTRAGAIAAHEAELRRIERDLHDGAQARLVSLSMRLGLARRATGADPDAARTLLNDAQNQAEEALAELRHVVRAIHPPILSDRGLPGAVRALAASSGLAVTVLADELDSGPRAPAAVEAAAYFVVAEALTNSAKHSGADRAEVGLARTRTGLWVMVRDNGMGGAREGMSGSAADDVRAFTDSAAAGIHAVGGSGLSGMRRRVAALDGTFIVFSPVGGPTVVEAELPCVW